MNSPLRRVRSDHLLIAGGLALLVVAVLLFGRTPVTGADPNDVFQGSTQYTTPSGARAFHDLLGELGTPVVRHRRAPDTLPPDLGALFVIAPSHAPEEAGIASLASWVDRGGTLVWLPARKTTTSQADAMLKPFGLSAKARTGEGTETSGTLAPLGGRGAYALRVGGALALARPEAGVLVQDAAGAVLAAAVPKGRGRFIALMDLDLVANGGLKTADHAEFMVHLATKAARGRRVAFDEYHHGFRESDTVLSLLMGSPLGAAAGLLVLAGFAAVFSRGRRLGPPVDTRDERRRRPSEALDAFAGVAGRLRAAPEAMRLILGEFEGYLEKELGTSKLPPAEHAAVRAGLAEGELTEALEAARLVAGSRADEPAFLQASRGLERVRRRLTQQREKQRRAAR